MINTREIALEYRLSHWSAIIHERNASGKSIKSYCESIGLHQNVYHYWQRKLREAACTEMLPATVNSNEVSQVPNGWAVCNTSQSQTSSKCSEFTIEIGKSRVSTTGDVDINKLRDICQMLMSLC